MTLDCDSSLAVLRCELSFSLLTTFLSRIIRDVEEDTRREHLVHHDNDDDNDCSNEANNSICSVGDGECVNIHKGSSIVNKMNSSPDHHTIRQTNGVHRLALSEISQRLPTELWPIALLVYSS